jgi:dTMP kinase
MVEKYLNGEYGKDISAKQASIFYAIDRFQSYHDNKQDLKSYDYILSNRYVSANMIHQAGKIENEAERNEFLNWI